jgi:6-phosphogluconolactonase
MQLHIYKTNEELITAFADWIVDYIKQTLSQQNRFTIALSGGSTPKKLYELLASDDYKNKIDWSKIHFFFGDERYVPFEDERNNAHEAFETLLNHVPVIKQQIHVMRTDIEVEKSVEEYENILHNYFTTKTFDLVLLGLGDNAHTLSLFPHQPVIHEQKKRVDYFFLQEQNMYRITLTAPVVNESSCIAYLVTGKNKATAVKEILSDKYNPNEFPAQIIKPANGQLHWFLDEDAASLLK